MITMVWWECTRASGDEERDAFKERSKKRGRSSVVDSACHTVVDSK